MTKFVYGLLVCAALSVCATMQVTARTSSTGYAEVGGTRLYYEARGKGERIVVFIHGGLVDSRLWDDQMLEFAKRFRVIRYDLRGFGRSAAPTGKFSHIADLYALLRFLKVERATVVGLSLGGMIATDFALEHPEMTERLVLVGSGLRGFSAPPNEEVVRLFRTAKTDGAEKYAQQWLATPLFTAVREQPPVKARMLAMMRDNYKTLAQLTDDLLVFPPTPTIERLSTLRASTLVIVGSRDYVDLLNVADILATKIPGARKVVMPGASHHPNIEQPREFNRVVFDFLNRTAPPQAVQPKGGAFADVWTDKSSHTEGTLQAIVD